MPGQKLLNVKAQRRKRDAQRLCPGGKIRWRGEHRVVASCLQFQRQSQHRLDVTA